MTSALLIGVVFAMPPAAPSGEAVTRLSVRPMPAPKPALRYQLLPEVRELNPGDSVQWYLRCFAEQRHFFFGKQCVEARARYRAMTLAELAKDPAENYAGRASLPAAAGARTGTAA